MNHFARETRTVYSITAHTSQQGIKCAKGENQLIPKCFLVYSISSKKWTKTSPPEVYSSKVESVGLFFGENVNLKK